MNNRLGISALSVYLAMAAVAAYVATLGKLGGVYLIILTFPWSHVGLLMVDLIDPTLFDNVAWGIGISFVGVVANGFIIFRVFSWRGAKDSGEHAA